MYNESDRKWNDNRLSSAPSNSPLVNIIKSREIFLVVIANRTRIFGRSQYWLFRCKFRIELRHVVCASLEKKEDQCQRTHTVETKPNTNHNRNERWLDFLHQQIILDNVLIRAKNKSFEMHIRQKQTKRKKILKNDHRLTSATSCSPAPNRCETFLRRSFK